jgi:transcriptional regulator with XRE-family HTH domain
LVDDLDWLDGQLGKRIRDARERATPKLTQDALAQRAGLARTSITNIETGNQQPTLHALWRIADALGVSPCDLLPPWPRPGENPNTSELPADVPQGTRAFLEGLEHAVTATRRRT